LSENNKVAKYVLEVFLFYKFFQKESKNDKNDKNVILLITFYAF